MDQQIKLVFGQEIGITGSDISPDIRGNGTHITARAERPARGCADDNTVNRGIIGPCPKRGGKSITHVKRQGIEGFRAVENNAASTGFGAYIEVGIVDHSKLILYPVAVEKRGNPLEVAIPPCYERK